MKTACLRKAACLILLLTVIFNGRGSAVPELNQVGACPGATRGSLCSTFVQGNFAYLGTDGGMFIADVSDPANLRRVGEISPGGVSALVVKGSLACMGVKDGFKTADVSDPAHPVVIGSLDLVSSQLLELELCGDLVYAACYRVGTGTQGELLVINISTPSKPVVVGRYSGLVNRATSVKVSGSFAYVAHSIYGDGSGVEVFNVANPQAPTRVGGWVYPGYNGNVYGTRLDLVGTRLYVAAGGCGLYILDISNPATPAVIGHDTSCYSPFGLQVLGDLALVADHSGGFAVLDVSVPANIRTLGRTYPTTYFVNVFATGSRAYLTDLYGGLNIIDFSIPTAPSKLGSWVTEGETHDIQVQEGYVYVADGWAGMSVFDVRNPAAPKPSEVFPYQDLPNHSDLVGMAIKGGNAFLAGGRNGGTHVLSLHPGNNSTVLSSVAEYVSGNGMVLNGSFAYVAKGYCNGWSGIKVVNIQNPNAPVIVGEYPTTTHAYAVAASGNCLFVGLMEGALEIVDVSDPTKPKALGKVQLGGLPLLDVVVYGKHAYCTMYQQSVRIVDVSNPAAPVVAGTWDVCGDVTLVGVGLLHAQGNFMFVTGTSTQVFDLTNPVVPRLVAESPVSGMAITTDAQHVYVADGNGGLSVFDNPLVPEIDVECPAGTKLTDNISNKDFGTVLLGNSGTSETFTITNTGMANLTGLTLGEFGPNSSDFVLEPVSVSSLAPGKSTTFKVRFIPGGIGTRTATLQINSNDANENPFDINLKGTGALPVLAPGIDVQQPAGTTLADGGSRDFGNVARGSSKSLSFTVANSGNISLTGLAITIDGTNAADFAVAANPNATVAAGVTTTFTVRFSPTASGSRRAAIHIASNDPKKNPYDISLTGNGTAPEIDVQQSVGAGIADGGSQDFGKVEVGSIKNIFLTIRNTGSANLTGLSITENGVNASLFKVFANPASTIAPGGSSSFSVVFSPTSTGVKTAAIHIACNDSDENPYDINLTGTGTAPEIVVKGPAGGGLTDGVTSRDFGKVTVGATGTAVAFSIVNTGTSDLTGISITIDGTQPGDFRVTGPNASKLAPGASVSFQVAFKPMAVGPSSASLHILSNDSNEGSFDIMLTGTGIAPAPEIDVQQPVGSNLVDGTAKKSFGTVKTGVTGSTKTFTIKNTGSAVLSGLAISKTGSQKYDFIATALAKTTLAPGTSTTFAITFKPTATGTRYAAIHIKSNDANENPFDIQLNGMGAAP